MRSNYRNCVTCGAPSEAGFNGLCTSCWHWRGMDMVLVTFTLLLALIAAIAFYVEIAYGAG